MNIFRRAVAVALVACIAAVPSGGAEVKMKRLGEDPPLDGPPALDLTYVDVGRNGDDLEIRLGISGMTPVIGGYPEAPGIEWQFKVGKRRVDKRRFLAEAYVGRTSGNYLLFEVVDGVFEQVGAIEGTYTWTDGYISLLVPLEDIGAKAGTKIKGAGENDADAHVHTGLNTIYTDYLTTTKGFKVPKDESGAGRVPIGMSDNCDVAGHRGRVSRSIVDIYHCAFGGAHTATCHSPDWRLRGETVAFLPSISRSMIHLWLLPGRPGPHSSISWCAHWYSCSCPSIRLARSTAPGDVRTAEFPSLFTA